jgi:hypothetical protein
VSDSLKHKWWEWHKKNPHVWDLFVKYTFQAINAGRKHYSVNAIFERIRWHTDIETKRDALKISNNHRAYYARYFHVCYPEYDGFFRTKMLRSE